MFSAKLLFQLCLICCFCLRVQPAIPLDLQLPDIQMLRSCKVDKIYQFGASFSDTGNRIVEDPLIASSRLPYGQNSFLGPTGRFSNGLLLIDYIALAAGIPLLNPYLKDNANFSHGVNFEVGGATALSARALAEKNITIYGSRSSLGIQLEWMSKYFASQCNTDTHCSRGRLNNSLFMVGEIGRNDYNFAFQQGKTFEEAQNMVPEVIEKIKNAVRRVIDHGAAQVIVPGIFPLGCFPWYLMDFKSSDKSGYDEHHCLKEFNDFIEFHNDYLQQTIVTLQRENPHTTVVYADYFNAFKWLLYNALQLGFDSKSALQGCCGNAGPAGTAAPSIDGCGSSNVPVCLNPDQYISWDGMHFTQKAHSILATWVVADIVPKLNCAVQADDYYV